MLVVVLSLPRSGSSAVGKSLNDIGIEHFTWENFINQNKSEFNKYGYWEDVGLNLINDNLIRYHFGLDSSFLYTKNIEKKDEIKDNENFYFDLTKETVEIPEDYKKRIKFYTGHDWDVWGLTRMSKNKKWHQCYSTYNVHNSKSLLRTKDKYLKSLIDKSASKHVFIKDPRLIFTINFWKFPKDLTKYIIIEREPKDLLKSIRNHYGSNLFTENNFENFNWVSNHFNYKVKYQSFKEYVDKYNMLLEPFRERSDCIFLNFKDVMSDDFNNYISKKLNLDEIK